MANTPHEISFQAPQLFQKKPPSGSIFYFSLPRFSEMQHHTWISHACIVLFVHSKSLGRQIQRQYRQQRSSPTELCRAILETVIRENPCQQQILPEH